MQSVSDMSATSAVIPLGFHTGRFINTPSDHSKMDLQPRIDLECQRCRSVDSDAQVPVWCLQTDRDRVPSSTPRMACIKLCEIYQIWTDKRNTWGLYWIRLGIGVRLGKFEGNIMICISFISRQSFDWTVFDVQKLSHFILPRRASFVLAWKRKRHRLQMGSSTRFIRFCSV